MKHFRLACILLTLSMTLWIPTTWPTISIKGSSVVQTVTPNDGDWSARSITLQNTPEADLMVRTGDFSLQPSGGGTQTKLCRIELSTFYGSMQSLGTVWTRPACESGPLSPRTISDMQANLENARKALTLIPCIHFDLSRITSLSARLPGMTGDQAVRAVVQLIMDLQQAVHQATVACDQGVNLESLFVTGVHLGAAQAWASCFICNPTPPIPTNVQAAISAHLATAQMAFAAYAPCVPGFDFSLFTTVPLGSLNSTEPHTFIVGIETQVLWHVALSDCCCTCTGGNGTASLQISFDRNPVPQNPSGDCNFPPPIWEYTVMITETNGVGITITKFTSDFYDGSGNYINTVTDTGDDFATRFGTKYIGPNARVHASHCASLGGRSSGSIIWTYYGTDDHGNSVSFKSDRLFLAGR